MNLLRIRICNFITMLLANTFVAQTMSKQFQLKLLYLSAGLAPDASTYLHALLDRRNIILTLPALPNT